MAYEDRRPIFNLSGQLTAGVSALDTTLSSTAFATLPTFYSNVVYLPLVIANDASGKAEIVYVVGHVAGSTSVTVARGREGTTPQAFNAGDVVRCSPTPHDTQKAAAHAGQLGGNVALNTTGLIVPLTLQDFATGGISVESNGLKVTEPGRYRANAKLYVVAGANQFSAQTALRKNGATTNLTDARLIKRWADNEDLDRHFSCLLRLAAGDRVNLWARLLSGSGSVWGTTGYDGCYLELERVD